jgi:porin
MLKNLYFAGLLFAVMSIYAGFSGNAASAQELQPPANQFLTENDLTDLTRIADLSQNVGGMQGPVPIDGPEDIPTNEHYFTAPSLLLPSSHLFGDWYGFRTRMENSGITPAVTWVTNLAGNPTGGRQQGFTECENLGFDFLFDLQKIYNLEDTQFHVSMSQRSGTSLSNKCIGNEFNVQQVYGGETFRLVDFDLQKSFFDGQLEWVIGRIAAGDDFLASPYYWLFMQNSIDGNPVCLFKNSPGMSAYPNAAWGTRIKYEPTKRSYGMIGVYNGDSTVRDNDNHGMDWSMNGPAFLISEVGYIRNGLPGDEGCLGNYKAGVYYDGGTFNKFSAANLIDSTDDSAGSTTGNWGYYFLLDQVFYRPEGKYGTRGAGVFASFIMAPDESVNKMPFFFDGGVAYRGMFGCRPNDTIGFAVAYGEFSGQLCSAQQLAHYTDPDIVGQTDELVFEWLYRIRLRDGAMFFQPDVQYIVNPGAAHQYDNALVVGAQAGINF